MNLELVGFTITTLGEVLIGYTVLRVHTKVSQEHKIDKKVLSEMKKERSITIYGITLIIVGFFLQIAGKY